MQTNRCEAHPIESDHLSHGRSISSGLSLLLVDAGFAIGASRDTVGQCSILLFFRPTFAGATLALLITARLVALAGFLLPGRFGFVSFLAGFMSYFAFSDSLFDHFLEVSMPLIERSSFNQSSSETWRTRFGLETAYFAVVKAAENTNDLGDTHDAHLPTAHQLYLCVLICSEQVLH
jgi:hypothetical protein